MNTALLLVAPWTVALAAACASQEPSARPPAESSEVERAQGELLQGLRAQGIDVDTKAKTVTVRATLNQPADLLEYLLIHERGKAHEALFVTEVKASLLNSAFLLLGFENGKNARAEPIEPPPTEEEVAKGADWVKVFPPEGMQLWITASWEVQEGERKGTSETVAVEDLLLDLTTGKPVIDNEWIFLGGQVAPLYRDSPPVYVADVEGNLMSVCYLAPENHLVTMKHARARDDQNWGIADGAPPPGTAVTLRFHCEKPDVVKQREARLAEQRGTQEAEKGDAKGEGKGESKR